MKDQKMKSFCFFICMSLFVCLLISGANRLIVYQDDGLEPLQIRRIPSYLCCAPSGRIPLGEGDGGAMSHAEGEKRDAASSEPIRLTTQSAAYSDANGNILRSVSYMRSVYQSFDLGDGFV